MLIVNRISPILVFVILLSGIGCGRTVWDVGYLSPSTALTKQRHYEVAYETVFKAAYEAIQKAGLHVIKLDKQMGTIISQKRIGAYHSGWIDRYVIVLEADSADGTHVQIKYAPMREGAVYTALSSPESAQSSISTRIDWQTSTRKVNRLFDKIQRALGIKDIFGVRGLTG